MPCTSTCIYACNGAVHISNDAGLRPVLQVSTSIYLYPCIQVIHSTSTQVLGPAATATQPAQAAPFRSPATQNFLSLSPPRIFRAPHWHTEPHRWHAPPTVPSSCCDLSLRGGPTPPLPAAVLSPRQSAHAQSICSSPPTWQIRSSSLGRLPSLQGLPPPTRPATSSDDLVFWQSISGRSDARRLQKSSYAVVTASQIDSAPPLHTRYWYICMYVELVTCRVHL